MGGNYGGDRALEKLLALEEEQGRADKVEAPLAYYLPLTDGQTNGGGGATVTELEDDGGWDLQINLGPRNMRRVIAFLQALPDEVDEDGDGHRIGVTLRGSLGIWVWVERAPDLLVKPEWLRGLKCEEGIYDDHGDVFPVLYVGPFGQMQELEQDEKQAWEWLDRLRGVTR